MFLHNDERGSIIAQADCWGGRTAVNAYDEYGIPGAGNIGRFQYTGQAWMPELGMYHYKARMYSPTLGRFMQTDPIGYSNGVNWYNYVGSDPVNSRDPTGTEEGDIQVTGRCSGGAVPVYSSARHNSSTFLGCANPGDLGTPSNAVGGGGGAGGGCCSVSAKSPVEVVQPCKRGGSLAFSGPLLSDLKINGTFQESDMNGNPVASTGRLAGYLAYGEQSFSGQIGSYNVSANFSEAPGGMPVVINSGSRSVAYGPVMTLSLNSPNGSWSFPHELLHSMFNLGPGVGDRYNPTTMVPDPGWDNTLAASPGAKPTEKDLRQMMRGC